MTNTPTGPTSETGMGRGGGVESWESVERYDLTEDSEGDIGLEPVASGRWVRYSDLVDALTKLTEHHFRVVDAAIDETWDGALDSAKDALVRIYTEGLSASPPRRPTCLEIQAAIDEA